MMRRALFAMATGICLAAAVGTVADTQAQGRRPVTGPYVPSPVEVPSPVTVPGLVPPAATAPSPPTIVTPQGTNGQVGGQAQRPPTSVQPLPSPNGECRAYPGVLAGQKAPPPC